MTNLNRLAAIVFIAAGLLLLGFAVAQTPAPTPWTIPYSTAFAPTSGIAPEYKAFLDKGPPLSSGDVTAINTWISTRIAGMKTPFCWRQSYPRGVGVPLSTCPSGTEKNGLLCYPTCKATYWGNGPVCWQSCPTGYVDTGALCHIDKPLTKGGTWRCTERDLFGTCWWKVLDCPKDYASAGVFCALKPPSIPSGWSGASGLDLVKGSYGRGAGKPMVCAAGLEEDGGLCYTPAKAGYHGVGPVAWQDCPNGLTPCGAGCANSDISCGSNTLNMIMGPATIAANIASAGAYGSGEAAFKAGAGEATSSANALARITESPAKTMAMKAAGLLGNRNLTTGVYELTTLSKGIAAGSMMIGQVGQISTDIGDATMAKWADYLGYALAHFDLMTTPEVNAALDRAFADKPNVGAWVKAEYAVMVGQQYAKDDAIQHGLATAKEIAAFDPSGVAGTIAAFANPQCYSDTPLPKVTILHN
jgi:hypothetical protein